MSELETGTERREIIHEMDVGNVEVVEVREELVELGWEGGRTVTEHQGPTTEIQNCKFCPKL